MADLTVAVALVGRDSLSPVTTRAAASLRDLERAAGGPTRAVADLDTTSRRAGDGLGGLARQGLAAGVAFAAGMAGVHGAADAVRLFAGSVRAASDAQETANKSQQVFGDAARVVAEAFRDSADAMGLAQRDATEAAATFGNLFRNVQVTGRESAEMSVRLVQLAADLASFNNIDPTVSLDKLRSGMVGEIEPLRSVGILLSETLVKEKALQMGLTSGSGELSERAKVLARYQLILEQVGAAQGDFARTADGAANAERRIGAAWRDTQAAMGRAFLPVVEQQMAALARTMASDLGPALVDLARELSPVVESTLRWAAQDALPAVAAGVRAVAESIRPATELLREHGKELGVVVAAYLTLSKLGLLAPAAAVAAAGGAAGAAGASGAGVGAGAGAAITAGAAGAAGAAALGAGAATIFGPRGEVLRQVMPGAAGAGTAAAAGAGEAAGMAASVARAGSVASRLAALPGPVKLAALLAILLGADRAFNEVSALVDRLQPSGVRDARQAQQREAAATADLFQREGFAGLMRQWQAQADARTAAMPEWLQTFLGGLDLSQRLIQAQGAQQQRELALRQQVAAEQDVDTVSRAGLRRAGLMQDTSAATWAAAEARAAEESAQAQEQAAQVVQAAARTKAQAYQMAAQAARDATLDEERALDRLQRAVRLARRPLDDLRDGLDSIRQSVETARQAFARWAETPIAGARAFADRLQGLTERGNVIDLEMARMRLANARREGVDRSRFAALARERQMLGFETQVAGLERDVALGPQEFAVRRAQEELTRPPEQPAAAIVAGLTETQGAVQTAEARQRAAEADVSAAEARVRAAQRQAEDMADELDALRQRLTDQAFNLLKPPETSGPVTNNNTVTINITPAGDVAISGDVAPGLRQRAEEAALAVLRVLNQGPTGTGRAPAQLAGAGG